LNLFTDPLWILCAVITLGLALGKVRIGGIALDNAAVIFVGLVFGHFGCLVPEIFQTLGLVLFVFSVGMQSGPGFLASFGRNGWTMILPTALMIVVSVVTMGGLSALFGIDLRLALGLLTGGRSSNSALAVGVQSTASNLPALGHSLAYPLGVLAILLFVRLLPLILRADVAKEEKAYLERLREEHPPLLTRTFLVDNPNVVGKTLEDLHIGRLTGVNLSRILHSGEILVPARHLVLERGDLVKAVGMEKDLANVALLLGPETRADHFVDIPFDLRNEAQWFVVTNKAVVNQALNRLGLLENQGATVTRLQRNGIEISPQGTTTLRYADRIMIVAGKTQMPALKALMGDASRGVDKDFLPIFLILSLGLVLGSLTLPLGQEFTFSLGMTGGVLLSSLVLSSLGKTGPMLWAVSESSNRFVRQLGLLLFLGAVGTNAGNQIVPLLTTHGLPLIVTALTIAILPLAIMAFVCRVFLKMNILSLMGLLSGATTCSPALGMAGAVTQTNIPQVAYATVYPFAMIFMMLCTQIIAAWY